MFLEELTENELTKAIEWGDQVNAAMEGRHDARVDKASDGDQALAKMAEIAVGNVLGAEPDFIVGQGDGNVDLRIMLAGKEKTVDVKHSSNQIAQYLLWPRGKDFHKCADILIFCRVHPQSRIEYGTVEIFGWILKSQFRRFHQTANGTHPKFLKPDTWYMDAFSLTPIEILRDAAAKYSSGSGGDND